MGLDDRLDQVFVMFLLTLIFVILSQFPLCDLWHLNFLFWSFGYTHQLLNIGQAYKNQNLFWLKFKKLTNLILKSLRLKAEKISPISKVLILVFVYQRNFCRGCMYLEVGYLCPKSQYTPLLSTKVCFLCQKWTRVDSILNHRFIFVL